MGGARATTSWAARPESLRRHDGARGPKVGTPDPFRGAGGICRRPLVIRPQRWLRLRLTGGFLSSLRREFLYFAYLPTSIRILLPTMLLDNLNGHECFVSSLG